MRSTIKHVFNSLLFIIGGFTLATAEATTGGMNSGGGLVASERSNPWFLQNKKIVSYCVQINAEEFGVSREEALSSIQKAIDYWDSQLAFHNEKLKPSPFHSKSPSPVLRMNRWKLSSVCDQDTDVTFELGELTEKHKTYIPHPKMVVGQASMTEYDRKKMSAKGFIYIAPDSGPNAPEQMQDGTWKAFNNNLLTAVITHEMGHVLGLPHSPDWENNKALMNRLTPWFLLLAVDYPAEIVDLMIANYLNPYFFGLPKSGYSLESCYEADDYTVYLAEILDIPETYGCLEVEVHPRSIHVFYRKSTTEQRRLVYAGEINGSATLMTGSTRLFLSEGQEVFPDVLHKRQHLFGLESWDVRVQSPQKSLIFRTEGGRPTLSAWNDKKQEFSLDFWDFYRPATSLEKAFKAMQSRL